MISAQLQVESHNLWHTERHSEPAPSPPYLYTIYLGTQVPTLPTHLGRHGYTSQTVSRNLCKRDSAFFIPTVRP